MLSDKQQRDAIKSLEEYSADYLHDPQRINQKHLDGLQIILADCGLTIAPIVKEVTQPEPPTSNYGPFLGPEDLTVAAAVKQLNNAPVVFSAPPSTPGLLTESERGKVNTAYRAATNLLRSPGYVFKAQTMLDIIKITHRVAGEKPPIV